MKIVICASIDITPKIKEVFEELSKQGHEVEIPLFAQKIIRGDLTLAEFLAEKESKGDAKFRNSAEEDLIKRYYRLIKDCDAVLILNTDKKGIKNYIGGNTLLEMSFAYVLEKKIFLFNDIPDIPFYKDEIIAMKPVILNGDLSLVR